MGINSRRKKAFFEDHPICCFCGGGTNASTQDHFPSRAIFIDRQWPEGYVFPACDFCQKYSVEDEVIIKFLARANSRYEGRDPDGDMIKTLRGVESIYPGLLKATEISANEKRSVLRTYGKEMPPGQPIANAPIISLNDARFERSVTRFANKLFCALYYFHTNTILQPEGSIFYSWIPNMMFLGGDAEKKLMSLVGFNATVKRGNTNLAQQFRYLYVVTETNDRAAFAVAFHNSFVLFGVIVAGASRPPVSDKMIELKPLKFSSSLNH